MVCTCTQSLKHRQQHVIAAVLRLENEELHGRYDGAGKPRHIDPQRLGDWIDGCREGVMMALHKLEALGWPKQPIAEPVEVQSAAVAASPSGPADAEIEAGYNAYCKRLGFQNYPLSWQYWLEAVRWSEQWRSATEPRGCPTPGACSCPAIRAVDLGDDADMYRAV